MNRTLEPPVPLGRHAASRKCSFITRALVWFRESGGDHCNVQDRWTGPDSRIAAPSVGQYWQESSLNIIYSIKENKGANSYLLLTDYLWQKHISTTFWTIKCVQIKLNHHFDKINFPKSVIPRISKNSKKLSFAYFNVVFCIPSRLLMCIIFFFDSKNWMNQNEFCRTIEALILTVIDKEIITTKYTLLK